MWFADKALPKGERPALIAALACAVLSASLMRGGFWSFLFLIPLGFAAGAFGSASAWLSCAAASVLNFCAVAIFYRGAGFFPLLLNNLYFIVMSAGFTWIMTGKTVRTAYRFIAACAAGTLVFLLIILGSDGGYTFREIILRQAEALSAAYLSASEPDAVRRTLLEQAFTPENILAFVIQIVLRGGALVSCFFLFFFSRQAALAFAWLLNRRKQTGLSAFHAPPEAIWALSLCLGAVLLFRRAGLEIPEIAAWNFLVICGIIFLAQGAGIVLHSLNRRPPAARMFGSILIAIFLFSPGINVLPLGILFLLGIAENWLPLRAADRPASTPEP